MDEKQVLMLLKNDKRFASIPDKVLTNSKKEEDIVRTHKLGSDSFSIKLVEVADSVKTLRELGSYWSKLEVLLPKEDQAWTKKLSF